MPLVPLLEHKNADFVLEMPENEGSKPQKRTKTSILCSKSLKTGVSNPQKHKNPDFVLGKVDRRAWVQQQANAKSIGKKKESCGPPKRSIEKKKESCEPPKLSIGKSKCAQICLFLKLVR